MAQLPENVFQQMKAAGYSDAQISAAAMKRGLTVPTPQPQRSTLGNIAVDVGETIGGVAGSLVKRGKAIGKTLTQETNPLRATGSFVKEIGGAIGDVVGGTAIGAGKVLAPESVEQATGEAVRGVVGSQPVQNAVSGYQAWKAQHPDAALALEAGTNLLDVATLAVPSAIKAGVKAAVPKASVIGGALEEGGKAMKAGADIARTEELAQMVFPQETKLGLLGGESVAEAGLKTGKVSGGMTGISSKLSDIPQVRTTIEAMKDTLQAPPVLFQGKAVAGNFNRIETTIDQLNRARDVMPPKTAFDPYEVRAIMDGLKPDVVGRFKELPNGGEIFSELVDRFFTKFYNVEVGGARKYSDDLNGLNLAFKDWKKAVREEYGGSVFGDAGGSLRKVSLEQMRDTMTQYIGAKIGGEAGQQFVDTGKKLATLEDVQDIMAGKYRFEANKSFTEKIRSNPTMAAIYGVSGVAAITLGMFMGPAAPMTALALLATGKTIQIGAKKVTSSAFKESLGQVMENAGRVMRNSKSVEDAKIAKDAYISTAILLANFLELEYEARNQTP